MPKRKRHMNMGGTKTKTSNKKKKTSNFSKKMAPKKNATEIKAIDTGTLNGGSYLYLQASSTSSANVVALLNNPINGTSFFNRIGNKIHMKSLKLSFFVIPSYQKQTGSDYCSVAVVYDKQPNGALPVWKDVFMTQESVATTNYSNAASQVNLLNRERFKVLIHDSFLLPPNTPAEDSTAEDNQAKVLTDYDNPAHKEYFIPLGLDTIFKGSTTTGGDIGDISTGSLLLMVQGTYAATFNGYNLEYQSRVRFYDS